MSMEVVSMIWIGFAAGGFLGTTLGFIIAAMLHTGARRMPVPGPK